ATLSANSLSNRINLEGTKNELKDLASVINTMLDRIERSYNSQKQFVSDASHELRTPIAVIQGYVKMLDRRDLSR
ncbi:MAG: sensor histidine kinase, partial [Clostridia bacterium]|nr:sensor histidine kinase [Clostridia bacterium]